MPIQRIRAKAGRYITDVHFDGAMKKNYKLTHWSLKVQAKKESVSWLSSDTDSFFVCAFKRYGYISDVLWNVRFEAPAFYVRKGV